MRPPCSSCQDPKTKAQICIINHFRVQGLGFRVQDNHLLTGTFKISGPFNGLKGDHIGVIHGDMGFRVSEKNGPRFEGQNEDSSSLSFKHGTYFLNWDIPPLNPKPEIPKPLSYTLNCSLFGSESGALIQAVQELPKSPNSSIPDAGLSPWLMTGHRARPAVPNVWTPE